jgi:hypothetical protein
MSGRVSQTTLRHLAHTDGVNDEEPDLHGFDSVLSFLGLLIAGIVVFVALLYGFFWLMFDSGN